MRHTTSLQTCSSPLLEKV